MPSPYIRALLGDSLPAPRPRILEGEVIGGELGRGQVQRAVPGPGGATIDGQVVQDGPLTNPTLLGLPGGSAGAPPPGGVAGGGGISWKPIAAGTAAAGAGIGGLMMLGDDEEAQAGDSTSTAGAELENVTPRQQALVDATDLAKKNAGTDSDTVLTNLKASLPEEDSSWLDSLAGEFDLTTVGMALLASNDGSKSFSANLGDALMAGRAVRKRDKEVAEAKALRNEDRDIAKEQREFENRLAQGELSAKELTAQASMQRAKASMLGQQYQIYAAQKAALGDSVSTKTPNKQEMKLLAAEVETLVPGLSFKIDGDNPNNDDVTSINYLSRNLQMAEALAKKNGQNFTDRDRAETLQGLLEGSTVQGTKWFGLKDTVDIAPRAIPGQGRGQSVTQGGQPVDPRVQAILQGRREIK